MTDHPLCNNCLVKITTNTMLLDHGVSSHHIVERHIVERRMGDGSGRPPQAT